MLYLTEAARHYPPEVALQYSLTKKICTDHIRISRHKIPYYLLETVKSFCRKGNFDVIFFFSPIKVTGSNFRHVSFIVLVQFPTIILSIRDFRSPLYFVYTDFNISFTSARLPHCLSANISEQLLDGLAKNRKREKKSLFYLYP